MLWLATEMWVLLIIENSLIHFNSLFLSFFNCSVIIYLWFCCTDTKSLRGRFCWVYFFQLLSICIKINLLVTLTYMFFLFPDLFLQINVSKDESDHLNFGFRFSMISWHDTSLHSGSKANAILMPTSHPTSIYSIYF